ncbi:ATP-dependent RNA helicase mss116 [Cordyceps militaris CM01]|uniref:ATP-dependent RNA helicase n=1 Tax=Cordyceps militaris (strain CM01) TaxID=983644 RepID=G3JJ37_CORMM|nr:ATP-dependent RNA helicase mss116 [Cordyceps militaris CM01]EGX91184.1 ATP-dependent RNA helicase mss116 [Cordyceps militaris CM01]
MFRQGLRASAGLARRVLPRAAVTLGRQQRIATQSIRPSMPVAQSWNAVSHIARFYSSDAAAPAAETATEQQDARKLADDWTKQFASLADMGVNETLLRAITKDLGYQTMSPVQEKTIAPALKGTDIVAQAKTGTGKTIAFLLPLLQRMINEDPTLATRSAKYQARSNDIRGIVLSPTRELAEQIAEEARRLTRHTGLVVQSAVGGTMKNQMLYKTRREGCHLLVATPGRLHDLLSDERSGLAAPNLAAMVLDEADRMLDVGFERELKAIIDLLPRPDEKVRQTMLVSATIPDSVIRLTRSMVRADDFEFVQTISESDSLTHDHVNQNLVVVSHMNNVFPALFELIDKAIADAKANPDKSPFKGIVYLNTTAMTQLAGEMGFAKNRDRTFIRNFAIHSGLTQSARTRAAENFRKSESGILFSSDVTARGMDFPDVTHVIQIDCPRDRETYIHRLGRTARQQKDGEGWLLLPAMSRSRARGLLRGLPLQPNTSLESATFDVASGDAEPEAVTATKQLYPRMPSKVLEEAYRVSIFSSTEKHARDDMVVQMNEWVTQGWGWQSPPTVSKMRADRAGFGRTDLNFGTEQSSSSDSPRRSDRFGGRDFDRNDRNNRRSSDPFDGMRTDARRDSPGGRGGSSRGGFRRGSDRNSGRNSDRNSDRSRGGESAW